MTRMGRSHATKVTFTSPILIMTKAAYQKHILQ